MAKNENLLQLIREACFEADITPMSKDTAAKILAFLLHYGGDHEQVLFSQHAESDRLTAQRIGNVYWANTPKDIPDAETAELLKFYDAQIEESYYSDGVFLDWVLELFERYGIKVKQGSNFKKTKIVKKDGRL